MGQTAAMWVDGREDGVLRPIPMPRLQAVLFDLDGTLLDIDGEGFLDAYVEYLTATWAPADNDAFRHAVMAAAVPIFATHPDRTTGQVFREHLAVHIGCDPAEVAERMGRINAALPGGLQFPHQRRAEARTSVLGCLALGLQVAVATTPIYAPEVIALRLAWAGLDDLPWNLVTHSENMHTCKPSPGYFLEAASLLGLPPSACVMVGDDPLQDGPAAEAGMHTLLPTAPGRPGWRGMGEVLDWVAEHVGTAEAAKPPRRDLAMPGGAP